MVASGGRESWVVLVHRVPREPSTPRIAVWRRLRSLGVVQLGDGAVALPDDARTCEHLEWVADQVIEAGGTALLLRAQTLTRRDEQRLAQTMADARAAEYRDLAARAAVASADATSPADALRTVKRLRKELRDIQRRDFFPPSERDAAAAAVADCAARFTDLSAADRPDPAVAGRGEP